MLRLISAKKEGVVTVQLRHFCPLLLKRSIVLHFEVCVRFVVRVADLFQRK